MRLRSILTILLACVAMLLPVTRAMAQAEIPVDIIQGTTLTEEQKQVIDKFIAQRLPDLSSSDPAVMKKSRDELLRPFRNTQISVAFRQSFSDRIVGELDKNAGNAKDLIAVNALRIAGDVATGGTSTLLEKKLSDSNDAVRYAAVNGLERTMEAVGTRNSAIPANRVQDLVSKLGDVTSDARSTPDVVDAGLRALRRAMEINKPGFDIRPLAYRTLTGAVGKLCERPESPVKQMLRAGQIIRDPLTVNNGPLELKGDSLTQAATASGQLLSWCHCQIKKGRMPVDKPELRGEAAQIVKVAENAIVLASNKSGKQTLPQNLGEEFGKATADTDRVFFQNLLKVLNPLNDPPFNIKPETFLQCK